MNEEIRDEFRTVKALIRDLSEEVRGLQAQVEEMNIKLLKKIMKDNVEQNP